MRAGRRALFVVIFIWLVAALLAGAGGKLTRLVFPQPQLIVAGLAVAFLLAISFVPLLRRGMRLVTTRALVALHLTRFVGIQFLIMARHGLSPDFALKAGIGDIAVASFALILLLTMDPSSRRGRALYLTWNAFGLLDILFVVVTAAQIGMRDPGGLEPLLRLPMSLLPTFLVPLIIVTHLLIFQRLLGRGEAARTDTAAAARDR